MLSKLFKYEFRSTARAFLPIYGGMLLLTLITRLFMWLGSLSTILAIPAGLLTVAYVAALFGLMIVTYVLLLRRFYTNLVGDEGYLSHTLPVMPWQHIVSKLVTAMVWIIASCVVVCLSLLLMFAQADIFRQIVDFIKALLEVSQVSYVMLALEFVFAALISLAASVLMLYASMAIGQLVNGHKVISSVAAFIGFYFISQILIGGGMIAAASSNPTMWETLDMVNTVPAFALLMLVVIIVQAVFGAAYFVLTNYVFKNKLNLE